MEDFCQHLLQLEHAEGLFEGLTAQHLSLTMEKLLTWQNTVDPPTPKETELKTLFDLMREIADAIEKHEDVKKKKIRESKEQEEIKLEDDEIILKEHYSTKKRRPSPPLGNGDNAGFMGDFLKVMSNILSPPKSERVTEITFTTNPINFTWHKRFLLSPTAMKKISEAALDDAAWAKATMQDLDELELPLGDKIKLRDELSSRQHGV